jgi:hypothetical protein
MIITSHMQKIIKIYPCLLKLSRKQESVTDGRTDRQTDSRYYYIPSPLSRGDNTTGVLTPWLELFVTALADFL